MLIDTPDMIDDQQVRLNRARNSGETLARCFVLSLKYRTKSSTADLMIENKRSCRPCEDNAANARYVDSECCDKDVDKYTSLS